MRTYDTEMALLGCVVVQGKLFAGVASELGADDFSLPQCRRLFEIMQDLYMRGSSIDIVTITSAGTDDDKEFAYNCAQVAPTLSGFRDYLQAVKDGSTYRHAQTIVSELTDHIEGALLGVAETNDVETLQKLAGELAATVTRSCDDDEMDATGAYISFAKEQQSKAPREYIGTGFVSLDSKTFIERGDYIVIGGESSSGKTAITLNMMLHMADEYNVVYFSLETSTAKMRDRIMAAWNDISLSAIKRQKLTSEDWVKMAERSDELVEKHFTIVSAAGRSLAWIQAKAMKLNADIIFVDYIGLINGGDSRSRYEEMSKTSIGLRTLAQTTNTTVFALCQLNRDGYGVPSMKSLKDSSQIENDADLILLLYVDEGEHYMIVAKNKEGRRGKIKFAFDGDKQRFRELYEMG